MGAIVLVAFATVFVALVTVLIALGKAVDDIAGLGVLPSATATGVSKVVTSGP